MAYIFLLLISLITHWEWTTNLSILTSGDWVYQAPATMKEFFSLPSIWSPTGLGDISIGISFYPLEYLYGLMSHFNFNYGLSERILFLWPVLIAFPIFSYLFIRKNSKYLIAAVVGSFVYCYNTYFLLLQTGLFTLLVAYAFIPLVLFFYQQALEKKKIKYSLSAVFFGFFVSFYEFRAFYIICYVLFFYYIFYIFFIEKVNNLKQFTKISIIAGLPFILIILLNAYWLLALGIIGSLTSNVFFDRSLFGDQFSSILYALSLQHSFWTGTKSAIFEAQPIPFYFWLIPPFAFLGLYLNRKNKNILFFGIIALLGIFLTKQVDAPFSGVYPYLYKHLPGFNAFREASKFYLLISLGYSLLIAGLIDWIWIRFRRKGFQNYSKYFITILIACIFLWNLKPIITGEFDTLFTPRYVPKDYLLVNDYILNQSTFYRTYWVPTYSRWSIYTNNHPETSAARELEGDWQKFVEKERAADKYSEAELIINLLQKPFADTLLDESSVKYVFVPLRDTANDDDFFKYYGENREYYIQELNKLDYLKKIDIGTKDIVVYENENFRPHIYTTVQKETIQDLRPMIYDVRYKFINPTEYAFSIKNVSTPFYLNFSESYNPQWKLRVGNFNRLDVLSKKNYFISDKYHFKNDAGLNSFYVNPKIVCKQFTCLKNRDGNYDIHGTLYFKPQSYMYLGLIISGTTLFAIIGYLLFIGGKYLYERKN